MTSVNRQQTSPIAVRRSNRNHQLAVLTSMPAGLCVPLAAIPMLREDSMNAEMQVTVEMQETAELLMNPVNLRLTAYLVPFLAFDRFKGSRDEFDRSYMKEPGASGQVLPFFETLAAPAHGLWQIHKYLGLHHKPGTLVNTAYLEAYNTIWNFRARNRSPDIAARLRLTAGLAPAFWHHTRFEYVVPDFDQAVIDGEVALNVINKKVAIKSMHKGTYASGSAATTYGPASASNPALTSAAYEWAEVYAELDDAGITVSLSNIELAKKTQAFAKMRERFSGHDDEFVIDMLMDGLTIPDQSLKQPILLADQMTRFAQAKRYATDAGNLAESAVSGAATMTLRLRVPKLNTGGIVMVMAEAVPEQLFERQRDVLLHTSDVSTLPEYLRDTLDPEQVDYVRNDEIDTAHATPAGTFGYAPLNWKWTANGARIGGKFYRPETNSGTDADRQRIWAVEKVNPTLSQDFYLVPSVHLKPFLNTVADPFEATVLGNAVLNGNTVFGAKLVENQDSYDKVLEKAPVERIAKP